MPLEAELNKCCASCLAPGFVCMKSQTFGSKPFSIRGKRSLWVVPLQPWNLGVLAPPPPPKKKRTPSTKHQLAFNDIKGVLLAPSKFFLTKTSLKTPTHTWNKTQLNQPNTKNLHFSQLVLFFARLCCTWTRKPSVHVVLCWSNPMNVSRFLTWLWFGDGPSAVPWLPWRRILDVFGCLNESRRKKVKKWPAFSPDSKNCMGFLLPIGGVGGWAPTLADWTWCHCWVPSL